jgi:glucokinase
MAQREEETRPPRRNAYAAGPRLIANIGATTARFALEPAPGVFEQMKACRCDDHADIVEMVQAYLLDVGGAVPIHAVLAIANPIDGDLVRMTNRDWSFSIEATREALGFQTLLAVNDFIAMAMALPRLGEDERRQVGGGSPRPDGVIGLVGASTGLGVSALLPQQGRWIAIGSEGGHASFSPSNETELAILRHAWQRYPHVSAERLISGPGLVLMHDALSALEGANAAPAAAPSADEIIRRGLEEGDALALRVLNCFCEMLGTMAGNLAVTLDATGGIYIGSTIVRRLGGFFAESGFRRAFEHKGRFSAFAAAVPTYMVLSDQATLIGAAEVLRNHLQDHSAAGSLLERIRSGMAGFSPAERRVANLVLDQPRSVLNDPVAEIAARAEVSQPTVIRFCRSLGLEGLSDFKLKLASGLTGAVAVRHSQVRVGDSARDLAAKVLDNTTTAIVQLRDHLDNAAVERAIGLLWRASRIELYGVGNSSVVALDGQHKFFRFSIPSTAYLDSHVQRMAAGLLGAGDVVIAISKSGNLPEILQAADAALASGAAVIAITAGGSQLARRATVALEVNHTEQAASHLSMVARILHLLLIDILAVGVAMRRLAAAGADLEEAELERELASLQARFEALISHAG